MNIKSLKKLASVMVLLIMSFSLNAKDVPALQGMVNDYANVLNASEVNSLESYLRNLESRTASQVALLIIPSLDGELLEYYSMKVADEWKLGQKDLDNGVLLLISINDRKMRIEVGYGLEGMLTDMKSGYIIRNVIAPEFKRGNYYRGIEQGLQSIGGVITQEADITPQQIQKYKKKRKKSGSGFPFGFIIFLIIWILIGGRGRRRGSSWLWLIGSGMSGGGRSSGGFGGGGGFGGFSGGGGSFGGGGSSGGW